MIQETVYSSVIADANFSNLAGSRFYPLRIPQRAPLPAAVYQIVNHDPVNSLGGDSNLDNVRMQVTCWAKTYAEVVELAAVVRNAIVSTASLKATTENIIDTEDPETKSYGIILDFSMWAEVEEIVPPTFDYLLLESGDSLLLESNDKLALEV